MAKTEALYYPTIDIGDEGWLKNALLLWDHIHTIVPESISNPYQTETTRVCAGEDVLKPLVVNSELDTIEELTDTVLEFLTTPEVMQEVSGGREIYLHPDKLPRGLRNVLLHPDKLPSEVRRLLEMGEDERSGWAHASPGFAGFYMTVLAESLSREKGLALLTDSPFSDKLANSVRADGATSSLLTHPQLELFFPLRRRRFRYEPKSLEQALMNTLAVEFLQIDPETPVQRILKFRENRKEELCRFRLELEQLSSSVDTELPFSALQQQAHDIVANSVRPAVSSLKETLTDARIKWEIAGLITVSTLSFAPEGALALAGITVAPHAILAAAGISLVAEAVLYNRRRKEILRENPYSYLLHAQNKFRKER